LHATSLQGFDYGDVVHQFEKRCNKPGLNDLKIAVVARAKNN
jgi:hypothetical protein